ncbi:hypothetical protein DMA12_42995 [Amycolatopsis balhimycina DSM 5908]|uniref:Tyr recombinase domain-containing protein n=1 Tax=Amycolatopsis balhimycina DSM 5908 TaxID=1081091 RepID=A0A428VY93_AMYBA|nr:tyrosine-type recombinase/integrase [Amycolatopsis balhimycina]RSM35781.1 hypothetical protein DMA12_42995 [Amycolatopsis balhimycina DSM 5908]
MTTTKAFTSERTQAVFEAACAFAGLDAAGAKRVRFGENAIFRLADNSAVVRVGRSIPAATKEVLVAGWLAENAFPAATSLLGAEQPFIEDGLPVTFARRLAGDNWEENGLVFASAVGRELDAANVRRAFRRVLKKAGLVPADWTPRELRHSFVSLLSDSSMELEKISRLVGHNGTTVTEKVYRHQLRPVIQHGAETMDRIFTSM